MCASAACLPQEERSPLRQGWKARQSRPCPLLRQSALRDSPLSLAARLPRRLTQLPAQRARLTSAGRDFRPELPPSSSYCKSLVSEVSWGSQWAGGEILMKESHCLKGRSPNLTAPGFKHFLSSERCYPQRKSGSRAEKDRLKDDVG